MTTSIITLGQTKIDNPFGLVYNDAIVENVPGKVNIHPVRYNLNGIDIAANSPNPFEVPNCPLPNYGNDMDPHANAFLLSGHPYR